MSFDGGREGRRAREKRASRSRFLPSSLSSSSFLPSFPCAHYLRSALPFGRHRGGAAKIPHAKGGGKEEEGGGRRREESCTLEAPSLHPPPLSAPFLSLSPPSRYAARGGRPVWRKTPWISNSSRFKITCYSLHRGKWGERRKEGKGSKGSKQKGRRVERLQKKKKKSNNAPPSLAFPIYFLSIFDARLCN